MLHTARNFCAVGVHTDTGKLDSCWRALVACEHVLSTARGLVTVGRANHDLGSRMHPAGRCCTLSRDDLSGS